jgi:2-dehydro-3-deoxygluconokinase
MGDEMILTFGEIMLRLSAPDYERLAQCLPGTLRATFGGGEANVAASLAMLGDAVRYLTALPDTPVTQALVRELRGLGVDTASIHINNAGRLGVYYLEVGANQRGSLVVYDRDHSAIAMTPPGDYPLDEALADVHWVHITGITPAISERAFETTRALAEQAQAMGATVSCDLNFRKKLWKWRPGVPPRELARACMAEILPLVDVAIGNEEDADDVLGIRAAGTNVETGELNAAAYEEVARGMVRRYPNLRQVAITLRESVSALHNNWGGMLFDVAGDQACFAPLASDGRYAPYEIRHIVDRVGGGDSFCAGLIHALNSETLSSPADAIRFAVAASCLKHSIFGDFNFHTEAEILTLMRGSGTGRVQR